MRPSTPSALGADGRSQARGARTSDTSAPVSVQTTAWRHLRRAGEEARAHCPAEMRGSDRRVEDQPEAHGKKNRERRLASRFPDVRQNREPPADPRRADGPAASSRGSGREPPHPARRRCRHAVVCTDTGADLSARAARLAPAIARRRREPDGVDGRMAALREEAWCVRGRAGGRCDGMVAYYRLPGCSCGRLCRVGSTLGSSPSRPVAVERAFAALPITPGLGVVGWHTALAGTSGPHEQRPVAAGVLLYRAFPFGSRSRRSRVAAELARLQAVRLPARTTDNDDATIEALDAIVHVSDCFLPRLGDREQVAAPRPTQGCRSRVHVRDRDRWRPGTETRACTGSAALDRRRATFVFGVGCR